MRRKISLFFCLWASFIFVKAQKIAPKGVFLADSIQIGEPVLYALSLTYPKELEVVFPDSLHPYFPFELIKKQYFPTQSDSVFSKDSALYQLTTFEIDTVQRLTLPVYIINEYDSTILYSTADSIVIKQVVTTLPDSVVMKINTSYVEVPLAFNYPYWLAGSVILLIVLVVGWLIFGKSIINQFKLYRLKKRHQNFLQQYKQLLTTHYSEPEPILTLWKKYLEKLTRQPYTTFTTKEITALLTQQEIETALHAIDRNIYGPKDESLLKDAYATLEQQAVSTYTNQVNKVKHG